MEFYGALLWRSWTREFRKLPSLSWAGSAAPSRRSPGTMLGRLSFKGRGCVVTGGSKGIGRAIVVQLVELGEHLPVPAPHDRTQTACHSIAFERLRSCRLHACSGALTLLVHLHVQHSCLAQPSAANTAFDPRRHASMHGHVLFGVVQ